MTLLKKSRKSDPLSWERHGNASNGKRTPEYVSWSGMIQRCFNTKNDSYPNYDGRGITVCDRWLNSFKSFLLDMGKRPDKMSLERIDNNGDYCPKNCRWATKTDQSRNQRTSVMVTHDDKTQCITAWAEELGADDAAIRRRIGRGWSLQDAVSTPIGNNGSRYKVKKNVGEIEPPSEEDLEALKEAICMGAVSFINQCKIVKAFDELLSFRKAAASRKPKGK